jgi:Ferritin-like domain
VKIRRRNEPLAISESELRAQTAALEEMHHATLPKMTEALREWTEDDLRGHDDEHHGFAPSRRGFLFGTGALFGGVALGIQNGLVGVAGASTPGSGSISAPAKLSGDLGVVALSAALENLAVATYGAALSAAKAGKLGTVPPAIGEFVTTVMKQHSDHAAAWNGVLQKAGKKKVTGVDLTVKNGVVDPAFAGVTDVGGAANLALDLENVAAATYLSAIGAVKSAGGIKTAATIQPVEMQHAAILYFALGQYPVPDAFASTDGARTTTDRVGAA